MVSEAILSVAALAAGAAVEQEGGGEEERPVLHVPRVEEVELRLDGRLDEVAWRRAGRIDDFTEVDPNEGAPADPATEVLLMRDDEHLYVGVVCHEPRPGELVLQNMARDAFLRDDDRVEFVFDTFRDGTTGYFFQISAAGSRGDALIGDNGRRFNKPWDGDWRGRTRIAEDRWVAEIAIPFTTLAFGDQGIWRANFRRFRGVNRTTYQWASPRREVFVANVSEAGELTGFSGMDHGLGITVRPYYKLQRTEEHASGDESLAGTLGGEVSWRITPQLQASFTVNTDFAETEVDDRRVNLGRFSLFFPEKRDFFLEDSTLFQFGERSGRFGGGRGANLLPYFSRRIGLVRGEEVPLEAGLRLAGRAGRWDLGFLGVHTGEEAAVGAPQGDLFVLRPAYRINEELAVGTLFTSGNPASEAGNEVVGADLRWTTTRLLPGNLSMNHFGVFSDDEATGGQGLAFGSQARLDGGDWDVSYKVLATQPDFVPALGFVRRPGQMLWSTSGSWEPRVNGEYVRRYGFELSPHMWTDLDGNLISSRVDLDFLEVENHDGDELGFTLRVERDRPARDFPTADGVIIPAGDYSWSMLRSTLRFSDARPLSGRVTVGGGSWYDGELLRLSTRLDWRPDAKLRLSLSYREDRASLSGGDFTSRVESLHFDYSFSTALSWQSVVQADNQSEELGVQSRLHYLLEDGREVFLVLDSGWEERRDGSVVPLENSLTAKLVYSLHF